MDERWTSVPAVGAASLLTAYGHLVVVAPHPEDALRRAGALIVDADRSGLDITVIVLTHRPGSRPAAMHGIHALAARAEVVFTDLTTGSLRLQRVQVEEAIRAQARTTSLILAPWSADADPEHASVGLAAGQVAPRIGAVVGHLLIWDPDDEVRMPWSEMVAVEASLQACGASIRGFTTLVCAAGPSPERSADPAPSGRGADFDEMFEGGDDPWASSSWYERRKRALTLAAVQQERPARVLDLGCSTGVLTRELARRAEQVVGIDVSGKALEVARRDAPPTITWIQGEAPEICQDVPSSLDLIVVSEVGYFLTPFEWWLTLGRLVRRLTDGGELILVHWRHPTRDIPLDGPAVHAAATSALRSIAVSHYEDHDVLIDGFRVAG